MGLSSHQSAKMKNDEWLTPPEITSLLGPFDLDPCSPTNRPWETARKHYTKLDDGLKQDWHGRVWLNPPFGKSVGKWLRKLKIHGNGIALVAARTETRWFYSEIWDGATSILFMRGRPSFYRVDGTKADFNSGAPIALVAYGHNNSISLKKSGLGITLDINAPGEARV